ncbi:MAG TPA: DUF5522 domain-containing protein [Prolixibacteraceae bacterium]|nr:hypothetical protein [Bacteroidales bacterium]HPB05262.1 DUF5522 domain-containing protein [Prolixibacteraceae bacterium]HQN94159.1 DUF5522 domain-containing protein [Prolixibacteraceae bacterium]HUM88258.1 DUF5522 domain-containing protein [Prolixibacteraceae bacterium]
MSGFYSDLSYSDELKEGVDFYMNPKGFRVMTEMYLRNRGWCCGNGCTHCPYHPKAIKGNTNLRTK